MKKNLREVSSEIIISEASKLFFSKGYKNTSLEEVARILGVTRPAIYHYFKSKEEIILSIIRNVIQKVKIYSEEVMKLDIKPSLKFEMMVNRHVLLVLENKVDLGIFFEEQKNLPEYITQETIQFIDQYYKSISDLYKQGAASGEYVDIDPSIAVQTIFGACNWSYKWYNPKGKYSKEEVAEMISHILLSGYKKQ